VVKGKPREVKACGSGTWNEWWRKDGVDEKGPTF
jgi:hypothetical protein